MKYSIQLSNAIHILAFIEIFKEADSIPSDLIAKSIETNPTNVRRIMAQLKKSNIIETQVGKAQPKLKRSSEEITLLDIYRSIEGNTNLIQVDTKTNPNCIVGANIQGVLTDVYSQLQVKVESEMAEIYLADIIAGIEESEEVKKAKIEQTF